MALVLVFVLIPLSITAAKKYISSDYQVKNLKVEDIPYDDGGGLMVSWNPLPKEKRIIKYRVYRGATKDSLFFIGEIPVNPKTGVTSPVMSYYDKGLTEFVDIRSPGSLKKEKHQDANSPLFRDIPRDVKIVKSMMSKYDLLAIIEKEDFYYKTKRIEVKDKDPKTGKADTTIYAGLKMNQLTIVKQLKPGLPYYYTILAVDEKNNYFPYAKPVKGVPVENAPERPMNFYPVFVSDKGRLQFEWELPLFKDDIYYHNVYMIPNSALGQFAQYKTQLENYAKAAALNPGMPVMPPKNPATLVYKLMTSYPYVSPTYGIADIKDGKITDAANGIMANVNAAQIANSSFIFSMQDTGGSEVFSDPKPAEIITSSALPIMPDFSASDKASDKGDYVTVSWDKPVAYVTKGRFLDNEHTELLVNYEFNTNKFFKIKHLYFTFTDSKGKQIANFDEYYLDKQLVIKFPEKQMNPQPINVNITIKTNKGYDEKYALSQKVLFDNTIRYYRAGDVYNGKEDISTYAFTVYKKPISSNALRQVKKIMGTQREVDDNIRYESVVYKQIQDADFKKDMLLVDSNIDFTYDKKNDASISLPIYIQDLPKLTNDLDSKVKQYQAMLASEKDPMRIAMIQNAIDKTKKQIDLVKNNPDVKRANAFTSDHQRMKYIASVREPLKREFAYLVVKSDGKGHFVVTDLTKKNNDIEYFTPVPNWFYNDKWTTLVATFLFGLLVYIFIGKARKGHNLYVRPIAGISEIDNAIGRATEMGRPILFVPGLSGISDVATLAGLSILGRVAKKAAEYDTKILVPCRDYIVMPIAQEIVREAHYEAGRPDTFDKNNIFFLTDAQFAFVAGVNGLMIREKTATNFYMGMFYAESLIMTETGNATGAIQIAGTDAVTQIPFFITTCDYTLIGEELYAASAYMAREPLQLGTLKAQDYTKFLILIFMIVGTILSTSHLTTILDIFPEK